MAKEQLYICHGPHHIAVSQAHRPKGWRKEIVNEPGYYHWSVWFCPECIKKRSANSLKGGL